MSKGVNIGGIIRNEQGDTFPVALTPAMVGVIQNLLMQIPVMDSKLVDTSGKQIASKTSIPIIPREVEFDWDAAYCPMDREKEAELMKKLSEKYSNMAAAELTDGKISEEIEGGDGSKIIKLHPDTPEKKPLLTDPDNPFNIELEATGTANEGMTDSEVEEAVKTADQKLVDDAKYPDPIQTQEGERKDVTVFPDALPLSGDAPIPGSE